MTVLGTVVGLLLLAAVVAVLVVSVRDAARDRPVRAPRSHPEDPAARPPAAW